jgi:hypothetical protein
MQYHLIGIQDLAARTFRPDSATSAAQPEPQPARRRGRPRKSTPVGEKGGQHEAA